MKEYTVCRIFDQVYQMTFAEMLEQIRVQYACCLSGRQRCEDHRDQRAVRLREPFHLSPGLPQALLCLPGGLPQESDMIIKLPFLHINLLFEML